MNESDVNRHIALAVDDPLDWLAPGDDGDQAAWLAMPAIGRVRWLAPAGRNTLLRALALAPPTVRARRVALSALVTLAGWFTPFPGIVRRVSLSRKLLDDCLAHLGLSQLEALSVGTAGPRQRLTLLGRLGDGTPCIAKLGLGIHGNRACESEARALQALASEPWWGSRIPRLLQHGKWQDREYLVQTILPGRPLDSSDTETLVRLALDAPSTGLLTLRDWIQRDALRTIGLESLLSLTAVQRLLDEPIKTGWIHGDWAPWNARITPDSRLLIFDWEQAAHDLPRCIDEGTALICARIFLGRKPPNLSPITLLAGTLWVRQHWHESDWIRCSRWATSVISSC